MKLINPYYKIIKQEPGLSGIYKAIEQAGRTCYKSEDKITETSAKEFVDRMIKSGHGAMLEHGTVYLKINLPVVDIEDSVYLGNWLADFYYKNKYSKINYINNILYITTNLRVIIENNRLDDLQYLCGPTEYHEKRITVKFICDRGVSHELVRHRVFSFAQESTRYCNYSKDKFGHELTFIIPSWLKLPEGNVNESEFISKEGITSHSTLKGAKEYIDNSGVVEDKLITAAYLNQLLRCENNYFQLLEHGWTPQQARDVLPLALKTELVMTGFTSDWEHFFALRDNSHAHPDMQSLVKPLHEEFINKIVI